MEIIRDYQYVNDIYSMKTYGGLDWKVIKKKQKNG